MQKTFAVIGLGAVGSVFVKAMTQAGFRLTVLVGRNRIRDKKSAREGKAKLVFSVSEIPDNTQLIVIAVQTSRIPEVVKELSKLRFLDKKTTVLHLSGIRGASILKPLAKNGAGIAALHPYQTFPRMVRKKSVSALKGLAFGISGNRKGVLTANKVARALGGIPVNIPEKNRALYHASAVIASGFLAAQLEMAMKTLRASGVSEKQAKQAVLAIAQETIDNIRELGVESAMTGPATRGDTRSIREHYNTLKGKNPELAKLYKMISLYILKSREK